MRSARAPWSWPPTRTPTGSRARSPGVPRSSGRARPRRGSSPLTRPGGGSGSGPSRRSRCEGRSPSTAITVTCATWPSETGRSSWKVRRSTRWRGMPPRTSPIRTSAAAIRTFGIASTPACEFGAARRATRGLARLERGVCRGRAVSSTRVPLDGSGSELLRTDECSPARDALVSTPCSTLLPVCSTLGAPRQS
jgi:hypothetical protein